MVQSYDNSAQKKKTDCVKAKPVFNIAADFNETLITSTHIGSDYFPLLLRSKFSKLSWKFIIFKKKITRKTEKIGNILEFFSLDLISYFVINPLLMACKQLSEFENAQIVAFKLLDF